MLYLPMKYLADEIQEVKGKHVMHFINLRFVRFAMFAAIIILAVVALAGTWSPNGPDPIETTSTYTFDPVEEQWVKSVKTISLPPNPDGSQPQGSHTVIIRLDAGNPIKTIWVEEALVIGVSGGTPLLELDGDPNFSGTSTIRICTMVLQKVDAEELEVHDTEVVRVTLENVVAEDDELDIDVEVVNVIRCGRGGSSTLFVGVSREGLIDRISGFLSFEELEVGVDIPSNDTGVRVDRIRILGPDSGEAFIENLIIRRTSVFGKIEVKDVKIKDLFLIDVTLDDDLENSGG